MRKNNFHSPYVLPRGAKILMYRKKKSVLIIEGVFPDKQKEKKKKKRYAEKGAPRTKSRRCIEKVHQNALISFEIPERKKKTALVYLKKLIRL